MLNVYFIEINMSSSESLSTPISKLTLKRQALRAKMTPEGQKEYDQEIIEEDIEIEKKKKESEERHAASNAEIKLKYNEIDRQCQQKLTEYDCQYQQLIAEMEAEEVKQKEEMRKSLEKLNNIVKELDDGEDEHDKLLKEIQVSFKTLSDSVEEFSQQAYGKISYEDYNSIQSKLFKISCTLINDIDEENYNIIIENSKSLSEKLNELKLTLNIQ
jgi:hypothetical protein